MLSILLAHVPVIYVTRPTDDWCAVIAKALGGDIVMFEPGRYLGGCAVDALVADKKGERTVLQSFDPHDIAVIEAPPGTGPTLSVRGERLVLLELAFEGGAPEQAHVEVQDLIELTVRRTQMSAGVGAGVRVVGATGSIFVDRASFTDIPQALQLDCCSVQAVEIDRTVVTAGGVAVGATSGLVWDSTVLDAPGTALVWGPGSDLTIRGAVLDGVTGVSLEGPARIENSFLIGSKASLTTSSTHLVEVLGSTLYGPVQGTPALIGCATGVDAPVGTGTVACPDPAACWVDAPGRDFTPAPKSPLAHASVATGLDVDWCGTKRPTTPSAGALEAGALSPGPLGAQVRGLVDCEPVDHGTTTKTTADTGGTGSPPPPTDGAREPAPRACGCSPRTPPSAWGSLVIILLGLASRLRRAPGAASRSR